MKDEADTATIDLEDHLKGMHRRNDHETSVKAAGRVRRLTLREQVIDFARQNRTFTDDDLKVAWPDKPESSLRKRRTELAQENILLNTGMTSFNRFEQLEIVWTHRDNWPGDKPPIIERDTTPKQSKLARAEARIGALSAALRRCSDVLIAGRDGGIFNDEPDWWRSLDEAVGDAKTTLEA